MVVQSQHQRHIIFIPALLIHGNTVLFLHVNLEVTLILSGPVYAWDASKVTLFSDFPWVYSWVSIAKFPKSQNKALISSNTLQEDGGLEKGKQSGGLERNVLCNMRRDLKKKHTEEIYCSGLGASRVCGVFLMHKCCMWSSFNFV